MGICNFYSSGRCNLFSAGICLIETANPRFKSRLYFVTGCNTRKLGFAACICDHVGYNGCCFQEFPESAKARAFDEPGNIWGRYHF